jgi:hypothetical protein
VAFFRADFGIGPRHRAAAARRRQVPDSSRAGRRRACGTRYRLKKSRMTEATRCCWASVNSG